MSVAQEANLTQSTWSCHTVYSAVLLAVMGIRIAAALPMRASAVALLAVVALSFLLPLESGQPRPIVFSVSPSLTPSYASPSFLGSWALRVEPTRAVFLPSTAALSRVLSLVFGQRAPGKWV